MKNFTSWLMAAAIVTFIIGIMRGQFGDNRAIRSSGFSSAGQVAPTPQARYDEGKIAADLFDSKCGTCHGKGMTNPSVGADLRATATTLSHADIERIIVNGKGKMPGGLVSNEEMKILGDFLYKKRHPQDSGNK